MIIIIIITFINKKKKQAFVTLTNLLKASKAIMKKMVTPSLFDQTKALIAQCGPQSRFLDLFARCQVT